MFTVSRTCSFCCCATHAKTCKIFDFEIGFVVRKRQLVVVAFTFGRLDAAQLPNQQWLIPDVYNAYCELDREEAVNDMCEVHPLSGTMSIALYAVPTVYVHDMRCADPQK